MKKLSSILCAFILVFCTSMGLNASEIDSDVVLESVRKETKDLRLKKKIENFENYTGKEEVTNEEFEEIIDLKGEIQEDVFGIDVESTTKSTDMSSRSRCKNVAAGDVFVTMDSKTSGFRHGHAGIGGCGANEVIEANPGTGVKVLNNLNTYWTPSARNSGAKMLVQNASYDKNKNAASYAKNQAGEPYYFSLGPDIKSWYCSELVYRAWHNQGIKIGSPSGEQYWKNWGFVTPKELMEDMDTLVYQKL